MSKKNVSLDHLSAYAAQQELQSLAATNKATRTAASPVFFKTKPGEYAAHDIFIGITVPQLRTCAKKFHALPLTEIQHLISSKIHEERLLALIILVQRYAKADSQEQKQLYDFYLKNIEHVNNWDLVDSSAPGIVGAHLFDKNRNALFTWATAANLWLRRIAIVAPYFFIKKNDFSTTLQIAEMLLSDKHDLIHKATGWMLREVGKKDVKVLAAFLDQHAHHMPRTALRYAIEKLEDADRKKYLEKKDKQT